MSKLSVFLQVCNDNLVYQMLLWYFWALSGHSFDESVCQAGQCKQPQNCDCPAQIGTVGNYANNFALFTFLNL